MRFDIITIFPNIFDGFLDESLLARAQKPAKGGSASGGKKPLIKVCIHNLRKWTKDKHKTVDDKPYGGGVGMVMKVEPIYKAVEAIMKSFRLKASGSRLETSKTRVILFSPRGKKFDQKMAKRLTRYDQIIMISGRYEGVDERVALNIADEVISVGDYVLNGGEVAAMAVMETISRLIPGFIAKKESAEKFDHAQYTRSDKFEVKSKIKNQKSKFWNVPSVLLSGDHKKIAEWRSKHSKK